MSFVLADRVQETTTTTGTGTLNLAGAVTQFQSFASAIGNGNTTYYCIQAGNGTDWEVGLGTVTTGSPNTLARTTVIASSNSGSPISLTGTSTVFCDAPATLLALIGYTSSGTWSGSNTYNPGDIVTDSSGSYLCYDQITPTEPQELIDISNSTISTTDTTDDTSTCAGTTAQAQAGNVGVSTGKWYCEFVCTSLSDAGANGGICYANNASNNPADSIAVQYTQAVGGIYNGFGGGSQTIWWSSGQFAKFYFALDLTNGKYWILVPGASANWNDSGTANPATNTGGFTLGTISSPVVPKVQFPSTSGQKIQLITDSAYFNGTPPSGFSAWTAPAAHPAFDSAHWVGSGQGCPVLTVATLPVLTGVAAGPRAIVTDATSPTFLGSLTGSGSVVCPVLWNGTAWVSA